MDNDIERRAFHALCKAYVQTADQRQRDMGLQYTEAETHDLARFMARFAQLEAARGPSHG